MNNILEILAVLAMIAALFAGRLPRWLRLASFFLCVGDLIHWAINSIGFFSLGVPVTGAFMLLWVALALTAAWRFYRAGLRRPSMTSG